MRLRLTQAFPSPPTKTFPRNRSASAVTRALVNMPSSAFQWRSIMKLQIRTMPARRRSPRSFSNRVRHPAFPASICGIVFQGYERRTGCQFTFTCDGSLFRRPDPQLWYRAQRVAESALDGSVFQPVGLATHYHADYVVPYWASSLEKNAQVGAHIFYRWPNEWGSPAPSPAAMPETKRILSPFALRRCWTGMLGQIGLPAQIQALRSSRSEVGITVRYSNAR